MLAPVGPWLALPCPHLGAAPGPPDSPLTLRRKLPVCVLLARSSKLHAPVDVDAHRTGLPSHRDDNTYAYNYSLNQSNKQMHMLGMGGRELKTLASTSAAKSIDSTTNYSADAFFFEMSLTSLTLPPDPTSSPWCLPRQEFMVGDQNVAASLSPPPAPYGGRACPHWPPPSP